MKKLVLFLFVLLALPAFAQTFGGNSGADTFVLPPWRFCFGPDPGGQNACFFQSANQTAYERGHLDYQFTLNTVSNLPQAGATFMQGRVYWVSDGQSAADCSQGGGFTFVMCVSNGTIWVPIGGSGSSGSSQPFLLRTNSPNCTFVNQLVDYDPSHIDSNGVMTVQNAALGSKNYIGVVLSGAGCSGIATIGTYISAQCKMDSSGSNNNVVTSSSSVAGFCSDEGSTTAQPNVFTGGRISKQNTGGSGTLAQIDFFLPNVIGSAGSSGNAFITPCSTNGCMIYEPTASTPTITGDNSTVTNGSGSVTMKSLGLTDALHAGNWFETQGPTPLPAPTNSTLFYVGPSIPTPNSFQLPKAAGAADVNKAWGVTSSTTDGNGNPVDIMGIINASGTTLPGAGTLTNPSAPTLTVNGTPGSTQYCYLVIGSEDSVGVFHSTGSGNNTPTCTSTGNATLSSSNSITLSAYIDTTYGYRGVIVCRTTGGATQGVITNGLLASSKFTDTGLTADGTNCATTYASNTTFIWDACMGSSLPGNPSVPGAPCGVDGPPLTPSVYNYEATDTFGIADTNDPYWSWGGGGTSPLAQNSATISLSNGAIIITSDTTAGNPLEAVIQNFALPSTPYTFTTFVSQLAPTGFGACEIGLRESSTGKLAGIFVITQQTINTLTAGGGVAVESFTGTSSTTTSSSNFIAYHSDGYYLRVQDNGTNIITSWSPASDGVNYHTLASVAVTSAFTTAPNQMFIGTLAAATNASCTFDYVRRTQ